MFDLIDYIFDTLIHEYCINELLCMIVRANCIFIIQRLMIKIQHEKTLKTDLLCEIRREREFLSFDKSEHQSIKKTVMSNHVDMMKYLLKQNGIEIHLHYLNSYGENVLHLTSKRCSPAMFRLLVPRFLEGRYQKDNQGNTFLVRM